MKKLLISILRLLKIYTNKAGDTVSRFITLQNQIELLLAEHNSKIIDMEANVKQTYINLAAAQEEENKNQQTVKSITQSMEQFIRQDKEEDYIEARKLLERAAGKLHRTQEKVTIYQRNSQQLQENLDGVKDASEKLITKLEILQHEYQLSQINLSMNNTLHGSDSVTPTLEEIERTVLEIKAKDKGTQMYIQHNKETTAEHLERRVLSESSISLEFKEARQQFMDTNKIAIERKVN